MIELTKQKIHDNCVVHYKRRIRVLCDEIGIVRFGRRDMARLVNRLMLIAGGGIVERDLTVVVRLYARELIGRKEFTYNQQKELLT